MSYRRPHWYMYEACRKNKRRYIVLSAMVFIMGLGAQACKRSSVPPDVDIPPKPQAPLSELPLPAWFPETLPVDEFVGARRCAECHQAEYDKWKQSPHGRAMAEPDPNTVLGRFDGKPVILPNGSGIVTPVSKNGIYLMLLEHDGKETEHMVDLVLASGRQQQVYLTGNRRESYRLLPLIWASEKAQWISTELYRQGSLNPASSDHWGNTKHIEFECMRCHLSQFHAKTTKQSLEAAWIDLSVNCESCHGPGRQHVEAASMGRLESSPYLSLRSLDQGQDARLCGRCHGLSVATGGWGRDPDDGFHTVFSRGLGPELRPDGTQQSTSYQLSGHLLSSCYVEGAMTCNHCHEPHGQNARDMTGQLAETVYSNRQCTVCHRDKTAVQAVTEHSHHSDKITCVNCHMSESWISDTSDSAQRTSDHTIQIPHPQESIDFETPNACNTCHRDKDPTWSLEHLKHWGQKRALESRKWVGVIADLENHKSPSVSELKTVLESPKTGVYLTQSILSLISRIPSNPSYVPLLVGYGSSEDPLTRALAVGALILHDESQARSWWRMSREDLEPVVQFLTMDAGHAFLDKDDIEDHLRLSRRISYGRDWAIECLRYAEVLQDQGHLSAAVSLIRLALRVDSDMQQAHYILGVAVLKQGHRDEAIEHFEKYIENSQNSNQARALVGEGLSELGMHDLAFEYLKGVLARNDAASDSTHERPFEHRTSEKGYAVVNDLNNMHKEVVFNRSYQRKHPTALVSSALTPPLDIVAFRDLIESIAPCLSSKQIRSFINGVRPDGLSIDRLSDLTSIIDLAIQESRHCHSGKTHD